MVKNKFLHPTMWQKASTRMFGAAATTPYLEGRMEVRQLSTSNDSGKLSIRKMIKEARENHDEEVRNSGKGYVSREEDQIHLGYIMGQVVPNLVVVGTMFYALSGETGYDGHSMLNALGGSLAAGLMASVFTGYVINEVGGLVGARIGRYSANRLARERGAEDNPDDFKTLEHVFRSAAA